jgi:hypothetical protein
MPWTPDEAKANASLGGKAAAARGKARRQMPVVERARKALEDATGQAAKALVDAALGQNGFEDLDVGERLKAVLKVLDYGLGRPATNKPEEKPPAEGEQSGLALS